MAADNLTETLDRIRKQYGKASVMRLGVDEMEPVSRVSTGSIALDEVTGGGLPRGRIIEAYGPESSGKTTVALMHAAQVQRAGGLVAFIDAEHALDPEWAATLGVKAEEDSEGPGLLLSQPDTGEQGLGIADMWAQSGAVDLIIIDSVSALVPEAELKGEVGDSHVGLQARLMSQALRRMTGHLSQTRTTAFFINQLREKVGVLFGSPETTSGGKALKFYASMRLDVRRIETLKNGTDAIGNRVRVKVTKNKTSPPFKQAEFTLLFASGFAPWHELLDLAVERGIVRKSGAWYTYGGEQLGQGRDRAAEGLAALAADEQKKIREDVIAKGPLAGKGPPQEAETAPWEDDRSTG